MEKAIYGAQNGDDTTELRYSGSGGDADNKHLAQLHHVIHMHVFSRSKWLTMFLW